MKKSIGLTLAFWLAAVPSFAASPVPGNQIKQLVTNKTFRATFQEGKAWQVYFGSDGRVATMLQQDQHSTKIMKTGSWEVRSQDALCIKYMRKTTKRKRFKMTCGKIVAAGKNSFKRYDEEGTLHATFTYVGDGNTFQ